MKCHNLHGHTYLYELTFRFLQQKEIGYAIDFKEIKRVACQFIDDAFDHGIIVNPMDHSVIKLANSLESKIWVMALNGTEYCNPTVENIAKEIFLAIHKMTRILYGTRLMLDNVRLYETPNCFTDCNIGSIGPNEMQLYYQMAGRGDALEDYARAKGEIEYDDRVKI